MPPSHFPSPDPGVKQKCSEWAAGASGTPLVSLEETGLWPSLLITDLLFQPGRFLGSIPLIGVNEGLLDVLQSGLMGLTGLVTFVDIPCITNETRTHYHEAALKSLNVVQSQFEVLMW